MAIRNAGVDYETYYDKDCSITNGLENYLNHPLYEAYMVSIYTDDNYVWVGAPEKAPWERLKGFRVHSHNRSFDEAVHNDLVKKKKIPPHEFAEWHCTADMAAYSGYPRSLKYANEAVFGIKLSKEVRDNMKGRQFSSLDKAEKTQLAEYALDDSKHCLALELELGKGWPEWERQLSRETTTMCWDGVPVDVDTMDKSIKTLENSLNAALEILPWAEEQVGALSPKEWGIWCRSQGKEPPPSMAKVDPEVIAWMKKNPKEGAVLQATHILRGANSLRKKFVTMRSRVRDDGRLSYGLKYFGAHTGRDSGDAGFNVQNMPREGMYGANLRECIRAPKGKILLVADLAQIEARCVAWLAGEEELLNIARKGIDWYEAMARTFGMYKGESPMKKHNPALRRQMKMLCLGCQYKMSANKFAMITGIEYEDACSLVRMFRARMPKLVQLWGAMERDMRMSSMEEDQEYEIHLPSGRTMKYRGVDLKGGLSAHIPRGGKMMKLKFWAGTLIENATQGFARDVFMDRILALRAGGHRNILRVHDEVVIEADIDNHQDAMKDINNILTGNPEWCKTLPLGTDVEAMERYTK